MARHDKVKAGRAPTPRRARIRETTLIKKNHRGLDAKLPRSNPRPRDQIGVISAAVAAVLGANRRSNSISLELPQQASALPGNASVPYRPARPYACARARGLRTSRRAVSGTGRGARRHGVAGPRDHIPGPRVSPRPPAPHPVTHGLAVLGLLLCSALPGRGGARARANRGAW